MTNWGLSQECKVGLTFKNQSVRSHFYFQEDGIDILFPISQHTHPQSCLLGTVQTFQKLAMCL